MSEAMSPKCNDAARRRFERREDDRQKNETQLQRLATGKSVDWRSVDGLDRLYERARRLGLVDDAARLLRDPEGQGEKVLEQIIATNDLLDVRFLEDGAHAARSVGRLRKPVAGGNKVGTGFLVAPRVLMTNHHVIADSQEARETTWELDFFVREDGVTTGPTQVFRLQPDLLFIADDGLDFALVAVEEVNTAGNRLDGRGFHTLIPQSGKAVVGERLNIIQHPGGKPQQVALHDNKLLDVVDDFLHYRTDTQGGSSGSPVFNQQWDLVALHHAAVGNLNEGVRISSIVSFLRAGAAGNEASLGLLAEVLAPPRSGRRSADAAPSLGIGAPQIRDGKAHWTVPLQVAVALGDLPPITGDGPSGGSTGSSDTSGGSTGGGTGGETDPVLDDILDVLSGADDLEYFNATTDGAARDAYYPEPLLQKDGQALYDGLSDLLRRTHTRQLSYGEARHQHLYPWVDRRPGGGRKLMGVYSGKIFDAEDFIRRDLEAQRRHEARLHEALARGASSLEFDVLLESQPVFNCEHVVPQSWFQKRLPQRADMHHLFASETQCNGFRGHHAFFEFAEEAVREGCGRQEEGKFEPLQSKAAVARATLYFLVRYPGEVGDTGKEMPRDRLAVLLAWHRSAAPDLWELHRNAEIFKVQGNRNPFIDFPDLADRIVFDAGWT